MARCVPVGRLGVHGRYTVRVKELQPDEHIKDIAVMFPHHFHQ